MLSRLRLLHEQLAAIGDADAESSCDLLVARAAEIEDAIGQSREGPCRVACVGRTRAGKSTLRFALTGEGEDGIGRGGQRTTTQNLEYGWRGNLLIDTPGVGAYQGDDDVALATVAAHGADLVLWLVGSDGLQVATITPVVRMLSRGVPVLAVVNHKDTIDLADLDRVADEQLFTETSARERRVRDVLGRPDVQVLHAQLDLARWARAGGDDQAWTRSRVPVLERALAAAAEEAVRARPEVYALRVTAAVEGLGPDLQVIVDHLEDQASSLDARAAGLQQRSAAGHAAFETALERGRDGAARKAEGALAAAGRLACVEANRGKAQERLKADLAAMGRTLVADLSRMADEAIRRATAVLGDVTPGPDPAPEQLRYRVVTFELKGDPSRARAIKTARTVVDVGSTVLLLTPIGWAAKALSIAVPQVIGAAAPSVEEERAERERSVADVLWRAGKRIEDLVARGQEQANAHYLAAIAEPLERTRVAAVLRTSLLSRAAREARELREDLS